VKSSSPILNLKNRSWSIPAGPRGRGEQKREKKGRELHYPFISLCNLRPASHLLEKDGHIPQMGKKRKGGRGIQARPSLSSCLRVVESSAEAPRVWGKRREEKGPHFILTSLCAQPLHAAIIDRMEKEARSSTSFFETGGRRRKKKGKKRKERSPAEFSSFISQSISPLLG